MSTRELDGLVPRLMLILFKIDPDKALAPAALADAFGVTHRTSLYDQNKWLNLRPFEKADGQYRPHSSALGQVPPQDIRQFASIAGRECLFQGLSHAFLRQLIERPAMLQNENSIWLSAEKSAVVRSCPKKRPSTLSAASSSAGKSLKNAVKSAASSSSPKRPNPTKSCPSCLLDSACVAHQPERGEGGDGTGVTDAFQDVHLNKGETHDPNKSSSTRCHS
jgi:hypothetical protein